MAVFKENTTTQFTNHVSTLTPTSQLSNSIKIKQLFNLSKDFDPRRKKRDLISMNTTVLAMNLNTTTTMTSTKGHAKKPDAADGSYLEQSHITKPKQIDNPKTIKSLIETTSTNSMLNSSESLKNCLFNLNHSCVLTLSNCAGQNKSSDILCQYNLNYIESLEINVSLNQSFNRSNICDLGLATLSTSNAAVEATGSCYDSRKFLHLKAFNYSCSINKNEFKCNAQFKCDFNETQESFKNCFKNELSSNSNATTIFTTTTPPTSTSTTSSTTTATTTTSSTTTATTTTTPTTTSTTTTTTTTTTNPTTTTTSSATTTSLENTVSK
jgi:hypothetical protein